MSPTIATDPAPGPSSPGGWPMRLPFTAPPMLMNQLRSKTHWRQQHAAHSAVKDAVATLCHAGNLAPFDGLVSVDLVWHAQHKRRRDPDALAPMVKGCLDGLVAAGVLVDDSALYVHDVRLRVVIGAADPRVELTVVECGVGSDAAGAVA